MTCPHCDCSAGYHSDRARTLVSLFGPIGYDRAYFYCRRCGRGLHPFDDQAGIPACQLTPAVERLTEHVQTLTQAIGPAASISHRWCQFSRLLSNAFSVRAPVLPVPGVRFLRSRPRPVVFRPLQGRRRTEPPPDRLARPLVALFLNPLPGLIRPCHDPARGGGGE